MVVAVSLEPFLVPLLPSHSLQCSLGGFTRNFIARIVKVSKWTFSKLWKNTFYIAIQSFNKPNDNVECWMERENQFALLSHWSRSPRSPHSRLFIIFYLKKRYRDLGRENKSWMSMKNFLIEASLLNRPTAVFDSFLSCFVWIYFSISSQRYLLSTQLALCIRLCIFPVRVKYIENVDLVVSWMEFAKYT